MAIGVVGRKIGMTRVFTEAGQTQPVTVIEVDPNRVVQVKNQQADGYVALQVTTGSRRPNRVTKPLAKHYAKAELEPGRLLHEFVISAEDVENYKAGSEIKVDIFTAGQKVDVQAKTIGKGFAGTMKRHNFGGGRKTHGNSLSHRAPGSIGQRQTPGRVFPGKKMAGHMGHVKRTQQNLEVVRVDAERNLLLVKGAIPGAKGADVIVQSAVKKPTANVKA